MGEMSRARPRRSSPTPSRGNQPKPPARVGLYLSMRFGSFFFSLFGQSFREESAERTRAVAQTVTPNPEESKLQLTGGNALNCVVRCCGMCNEGLRTQATRTIVAGARFRERARKNRESRTGKTTVTTMHSELPCLVPVNRLNHGHRPSPVATGALLLFGAGI